MSNQRKAKVWIAHDRDTHLDFTGATVFGDLHTVFSDTNPDRKLRVFDMGASWRVLLTATLEATTDDWVLLTGSNVACGLLSSYFMHRFGRLRLLIFNAKTRQYVPREFGYPPQPDETTEVSRVI